MASQPTSEQSTAPPSAGVSRAFGAFGDEEDQTQFSLRPERPRPDGFTARSWDDRHDPRLCTIIDAVPPINDWLPLRTPSRIQPEILNNAPWVLSAVPEEDRMAYEAAYGWADEEPKKANHETSQVVVEEGDDGMEGLISAADEGSSPLSTHVTNTTNANLEFRRPRKRRRSSASPGPSCSSSFGYLARDPGLAAATTAVSTPDPDEPSFGLDLDGGKDSKDGVGVPDEDSGCSAEYLKIEEKEGKDEYGHA